MIFGPFFLSLGSQPFFLQLTAEFPYLGTGSEGEKHV